VPALLPYLIEPIFEQFSALIPKRQTSHPLGCRRPRIPDHVVFEKLVQKSRLRLGSHLRASRGAWTARRDSSWNSTSCCARASLADVPPEVPAGRVETLLLIWHEVAENQNIRPSRG
jgi:hypothetical protein